MTTLDTALPVVEGTIAFRDGHTWYRAAGELDGGYPPIVALHGGPGSTHDYLLALERLTEAGWPVVFYDQLGNGRSTHFRDRGAEFWTVELFLDELDTLLTALGIDGDYVLFGQSWGGMLAAEHAVLRPPGLRAAVIADSPASMPIWRAEAQRLKTQLPDAVQRTLAEHEAAGTFHDRAYVAASMAYYGSFVCRLDPPPPEVIRTLSALQEDPTVYATMNGPNDFHVIGTLRDWTMAGRLGSIDVPTLVLTGRHDEATPATTAPFVDEIPGVEVAIIDGASHMPHVEAPAEFFAVLQEFLDSLC
jgi:L-proline amide hydrolase